MNELSAHLLATPRSAQDTRKMLTRLLLVVGCASALRVPVKPQTTASMSRREFASVAAMGALFGLPMAAPAYDSIPTVDADFAKAEQLRAQREAIAKKQTAIVNKYVKAIEATTNKDDFIKAADDFALYVVGEQKFPEVTPRGLAAPTTRHGSPLLAVAAGRKGEGSREPHL